MTTRFPGTAKAITFIVTRDREKAKQFYSAVLGFTFVTEDPFAAVFDLNGTMLRISTVKDYVAPRHTILGWEVADIIDSVKHLTSKGVLFNRYDGFKQDELGIWSAPGSNSKVAWFLDPDGNNLSLTQF